MAEEERRDVVVERPNRKKASSQVTRWVTVLLLLVTAALMAFVAIGGWEALDGAQAVLIAYIAIYVIMAFFCARWSRGTLPLSAALGIILLIFAAIAAPQWLERDQTGFTDPAVDSGLLGLVTILIIPVQVLLIAFAMRGFSQNWNVEVERPLDPRAATA